MSIPFFENAGGVMETVRGAPRVLFLLDYDGTLTPIVSRPEEAVLANCTRELLHKLDACAQVTVVSGRGVDEVTAFVGLDLIYAGNHGLEIKGPGFAFEAPEAAAAVSAIRLVLKAVRARLRDTKGVMIEDKRLTASVHYRLASNEAESEIRRVIVEELQAAPAILTLSRGKKVFEIRPRLEWNKGAAARWILENYAPDALPVCVGDDVSDEDMFRALPDGITVRVGPSSETAARYHVPDVDGTLNMLDAFRACLSGSDQDQAPR